MKNIRKNNRFKSPSARINIDAKATFATNLLSDLKINKLTGLVGVRTGMIFKGIDPKHMDKDSIVCKISSPKIENERLHFFKRLGNLVSPSLNEDE